MLECNHLKVFGLNPYTRDKKKMLFSLVILIEPVWLSFSPLVSNFISIRLPDNSSGSFSHNCYLENLFWMSSHELKVPIDMKLGKEACIWMTCMSIKAKIVLIVNPRWQITKINLFFASSLDLKGQLTRNFVGSIMLTGTSKMAKIVPIGNPGWLPWGPSWKSFFFFLLLLLNWKASWLETW